MRGFRAPLSIAKRISSDFCLVPSVISVLLSYFYAGILLAKCTHNLCLHTAILDLHLLITFVVALNMDLLLS